MEQKLYSSTENTIQSFILISLGSLLLPSRLGYNFLSSTLISLHYIISFNARNHVKYFTNTLYIVIIGSNKNKWSQIFTISLKFLILYRHFKTIFTQYVITKFRRNTFLFSIVIASTNRTLEFKLIIFFLFLQFLQPKKIYFNCT